MITQLHKQSFIIYNLIKLNLIQNTLIHFKQTMRITGVTLHYFNRHQFEYKMTPFLFQPSFLYLIIIVNIKQSIHQN